MECDPKTLTIRQLNFTPLVDLVVLYSGGADSRLLLHFTKEFKRKAFFVLVDYGQKHVKELEYAKKQLDDAKMLWWCVKVRDLGISSGLTGNFDERRWSNVHEMNVPARNTIFISIAYSIAEHLGVQEIWYGPDYDDAENRFPDCYQEYVVRMNKVLEIAGVRPIKLLAPLLGWTKEMILQYLEEKCEVKREDVYSGYTEPEKCDEDEIEENDVS